MYMFKLVRTRRSWKEPNEVRKNRAKLESFAGVGKFKLKFSNFISHFPTSERAFLLQFQLFNFTSNYSTLPRAFQLRLELSNLNLSNVILNFPTARSFQLTFPTTRIPRETLSKILESDNQKSEIEKE